MFGFGFGMCIIFQLKSKETCVESSSKMALYKMVCILYNILVIDFCSKINLMRDENA